MAFAIEQKIVVHKTNPFNQMLIKPGKKEKKIITSSDLDICINFLNAKRDDERITDFFFPCQFWLTLIKVLQYTGIRRNQLLHIQIRDINEVNKTLFLREEGSKSHYERELPVIDSVFEELLRLKAELVRLNRQPNMQLFNIYHFKNTKCNTYKEMNFDRISAFFQRLSVACGVRVTPHRFRHTLATNLMKSPDRNITLVKELLGHSSITTTLEYIVTDKEQLRSCLTHYFNQSNG